tara:strand:- start:306 stop:566 length:261 start_codon:yes stop_codon:yes gene_type:complete
MPKKSKQKNIIMKPMDENVPTYARNTPYKSVNVKKPMRSKDIFEQMNVKKKVVKKKVAPKGFHYMADGKLMKDSDMSAKQKKGSKY